MPTMPISGDYTTLDTADTTHIRAVIAEIAAVPGCEPVADTLGNYQSVVRADPKLDGGFTITYPAAVRASAITTAITTAKNTAAQNLIDDANDALSTAVLMDRLRNNLDDVKTARAAIQGGSMFGTLSASEKAFLLLVCDELDALARLKVNIYEIVD